MDSYESVVHSGDKTSIAIVGMPASPVSDTLELLENLYLAEQERRFGRKSNLLKIARDQVRELALAHAKAINDAKATAAQVDFYKQYLELAAHLRELRNFFAEHYSDDLERATVERVNLFDLAKRIMLRNKA
jgi:hypothetical protein